MNFSSASIASLPLPARAKILRALSSTDLVQLKYIWKFWARPNQLEPEGDWFVWLLLAGRGFGKTRTGAEWIRHRVARGYKRIALVARTAAEVRDVIIEGESGLLSCSPPWDRPDYEPSKRRLTWKNGAMATTYSADEPDSLRGPQHDTAWADELASWQYEDAWDQLKLGLRLGNGPRICVTTTPRPTPIIAGRGKGGKRLGLIRDPKTKVTRGSTYDNIANLAPGYIEEIRRQYESTRLGRQEIHAEVIEDIEGALWSRDMIDSLRVDVHPQLKRVVVAIDPAVTNNEDSDETGIVVAGLGYDGHGYMLADLSGRRSPNDWARTAVKAYQDFGADRIIAEANNGGQLVEVNLRTVAANIPYKAVRAAQGKRTRAEPVAALYEQKRIHHVGVFDALEEQLCTWEPLTGMKSPDRLDAMVWAFTELALQPVVFRDVRNLRL